MEIIIIMNTNNKKNIVDNSDNSNNNIIKMGNDNEIILSNITKSLEKELFKQGNAVWRCTRLKYVN